MNTTILATALTGASSTPTSLVGKFRVIATGVVTSLDVEVSNDNVTYVSAHQFTANGTTVLEIAAPYVRCTDVGGSSTVHAHRLPRDK